MLRRRSCRASCQRANRRRSGCLIAPISIWRTPAALYPAALVLVCMAGLALSDEGLVRADCGHDALVHIMAGGALALAFGLPVPYACPAGLLFAALQSARFLMKEPSALVFRMLPPPSVACCRQIETAEAAVIGPAGDIIFADGVRHDACP